MTVTVQLVDGRSVKVGHIGKVETTETYDRGPETLILHFDDLDHPPFQYARERWTGFQVERERDGR